MTERKNGIEVYIESGTKRVLAVAVDWPGWCRSGKDEAAALEALIQAAPRYARILDQTGLTFRVPSDPGALHVCQRVEGGAATDMAVPSVVLAADAKPMEAGDLERATKVLRACWAAFDQAVDAAGGKELRKGPRGGGREREGIVHHVTESESGYVAQVGFKIKRDEVLGIADPHKALMAIHEHALEALEAAAPVGTPPRGPRGGQRWPARYFVRRVAYHVVDHTWELEDRMQKPD
jgi:hypothetical protein